MGGWGARKATKLCNYILFKITLIKMFENIRFQVSILFLTDERMINIVQEKWVKGYLSVQVEGAQPLDTKDTDIKEQELSC